MTPEQQTQFEDMANQIVSLTEMVRRMDHFFFQDFIMGQPNRAEQLDKVLTVSRGYVFSGKLMMMFFGALITLGSVIAAWGALANAAKKFVSSE